MKKWEEKKFKDFIKLNRGFDLPNEKMIDGEYPVVASTSVKGYHNQYKVKAPCVVTGRSGSLGTVQFVMSDCTPLNTTLYVKDFKNNHAKYVYYFLKTMHLETFNSGAGVPTLNQNHLHGVKVQVPDFTTQKRIADILSSYDYLIENNNRRIELLEKVAQKIYKEWFVRFRFPEYQNTKFINGLPIGWDIKPLGDIVDIGSSKRIYLSDYVENGIPFYRSKEIIQLSGGQAISDSLFISKEKYEEFSTKFGAPQKNDILITSVGTIGESYLSDGHTFYFKDGNLTWIKTNQIPMLARLIFCWLSSEVGKQTILAAVIGTSQSALTIENLKKVKICVPDNKVLEKFNKYVASINEEKIIIQKQNQNLKKQRDLLLPRLMSGKLEV